MGLVRRSACLMLLLCGLAPAVSSLLRFADAEIYVTRIIPSSAYPYELVHMQGGGVSPQGSVIATLSGPVNQTIFIGNTSLSLMHLGSDNLTLASTFADQSGNWSIDFLTPPVYPGDYLVGVLDNNSKASDVMDFHVLANVTAVSSIDVTYWPFTNTTGIRALDTAARWMSITSFYVTTSSVTVLFIPLIMLLSLSALALISGLSMLILLVAAFTKQRQRRKRDTYNVPCIT